MISWECARGRHYERERVETGTAQLVFADNGAYDATGANAADLVPGTQVKISWEHPTRATFFDVWTGYAEDWTTERITTRRMQTTLDAADGFELLAAAEVAPVTVGERTFVEQPVDDRIFAALDLVNWPAQLTNVYSGNVRLQETVYAAATSVLNVILDAQDAEFPGVGNAFMTREGKLAFRGRYARFNPTAYPEIKFWQLGDHAAVTAVPTRVPIFKEGMRWNTGKKSIVNSSIFTPKGVDATDVPGQLVEDLPSQAQYGIRSYSAHDLLILEHLANGNTGLEECLLAAQWYVTAMAQPVPRIERVVVHPFMVPLDNANAEATWDFALTCEIGDVVTVTTTHPGGGGLADDYFVERIEHRTRALNETHPWWEMTVELSPRVWYAGGWPTF